MDKSCWCSINRGVKHQPSVVSERMVLRPLMAKDAPVVQRLARSHKLRPGAAGWKHPACLAGRGVHVSLTETFGPNDKQGPIQGQEEHQEIEFHEESVPSVAEGLVAGELLEGGGQIRGRLHDPLAFPPAFGTESAPVD
jgi:hypothetical protein